jgi:hypothetical protein
MLDFVIFSFLLVFTSWGTDQTSHDHSQLSKEFKIKKSKLTKSKDGYLNIGWDIFGDYDKKKKEGNKVNSLINQKISIKGFVIPFKTNEEKESEFLLVLPRLISFS